MVLVARAWQKDPAQYNSALVFRERPDKEGGMWTIAEIEGGFRLTHTHGSFSALQAEGQKRRIETEIARHTRQHRDLIKAVRAREHDVNALEVEIRGIEEMLKHADDDINLTAKRNSAVERKTAAEGAISYWQNELARFQPLMDEMNVRLAQYNEAMEAQGFRQWDFLNTDKLEFTFAY